MTEKEITPIQSQPDIVPIQSQPDVVPIILILNGPPGCGKDTIADYVAEKGFIHVAFSDILIEMTIKFFNTTREQFYLLYNGICDSCSQQSCSNGVKTDNGVTTRFKDVPDKVFALGYVTLSARQALIHVSENVIKPFFGKDIFGKLLAQKMNDINAVMGKKNNFIISGAGFIDEIRPCIFPEYFTTLIKIYREGCSFANDSRRYIDISILNDMIPPLEVPEYELRNNDTLEKLYENVDRLLSVFNYNAGN